MNTQVLQKLERAIRDGALIDRLWTKATPLLSLPYDILTRPLQRRVQADTDAFYRAILKPDNPFSVFWAARYLGYVSAKQGRRALDFGCGKGRNVAHLRTVRFNVNAIDVVSDPYWNNFPDVRFDLAKPDSVLLPYEDRSFDLILVSMVLAFFDGPQLEILFAEFSRVLKEGGTIVLIEANVGSHARKAMRAYYGKFPEPLLTVKHIALKHFILVDQWYEGYYAKWFPMLCNLIYAARQPSIGNWMIVDPRSDWLEPERRGLWVLTLRKDEDA